MRVAVNDKISDGQKNKKAYLFSYNKWNLGSLSPAALARNVREIMSLAVWIIQHFSIRTERFPIRSKDL